MKKIMDTILKRTKEILKQKLKLPGKIFLYTFTVIIVVLMMYIFSTKWDSNILELFGWEKPDSGWFVFFKICAVVLIGTLLTLVFVRMLTRNLIRVTKAAQAIGNGDLSGHELLLRKKKFPDEIDELCESINQMLKNLRELVTLLKETSNSINQSSSFLIQSVENLDNYGNELNVSMNDILNGAKRQKDMVGNALSNIKDMADIISNSADSAVDVSKSMGKANETAVTGEELAKEAIDRMQSIFDKVESSGKSVSSFVEKFKQVNQIAEFITGIAQKTNLLALNASIEAARAGETGKGFSIVAEEIRKLADNTSRSASQISDLVGVFEKESKNIIESINDSVRGIAENRSDVGIIINSLDNIVKNVADVSFKVGNITQLSENQNSLADNVVDSAENVGEIAERNTQQIIQMSVVFSKEMGAIDKMRSNARNMSTLSGSLEKIVSRFKTKNSQ